MIERVHLRDFKSHEDTVVVFHPGANALLGQNGAGKTSVLQAIGLCLFDVGPGRQAQWHRKGTDGGQATVTFRNADGDRFSVERRVGASGAKLMDSAGVVLASGKADVLTGIRDLLGLEPGEDLPRLWRELVGVPQGLLTSAFQLPPVQRRSVFDAILRVDEYRESFDRLKATADHARHRVEAARLARERLAALLESAQANRDALAAAMSLLETHQKEFVKLEAEARRTTGVVATLHERFQSAQRLRDAAVEAEKVLLQASKDHDHAQAARIQAESAVQWIAQHQDRVDALETANQFLSSEATSIKAARDALAGQKRLESEIATLETRLMRARTDLEALRGRLPEAPDFDALRNESGALAKRLPDLETAMRSAENRLAKAKSLLESAKGHQEELKRLESDAEQAAMKERTETARQALSVADAEREATGRLATALDAQFDALSDSRTCPILDVTCPVVDVDLENKRASRHVDLDAQLARLEAERPALLAAAEAERKVEAWLDAWAAKVPRLQELRSLLDEARGVEAEELPAARSEATDARKAHAEAATKQQRLLATLATETHIRSLQEAIQKQGAAIRADEAHLFGLRQQTEGLAASHEELAALESKASEAEALLHRETEFTQALAVHRNTARDQARREADLAAAEAIKKQALLDVERVRGEADSAWSPDDQSALGQAEAAGHAARDALTRSRSEATDLERRCKEAQDLVARDEQTTKELAQAEGSLAQALRVERCVHRVRGMVKDLGPHVAQRFVDQVSVAADGHFRDLTGGRPVRLAWDRDYEVCVTDADGHVRTFGDLSGGEQVMAALAVRLSLLRSLSPVPFAVYDEPTINLDSEVRGNVARVLEQTGRTQLIVVSHDDAFGETIHNAIRLEKQGTRTRLVEAVHA